MSLNAQYCSDHSCWAGNKKAGRAVARIGLRSDQTWLQSGQVSINKQGFWLVSVETSTLLVRTA